VSALFTHPDGTTLSFDARIVVFGPHGAVKPVRPGLYTVQVQPTGGDALWDGGVFTAKDLMKPAVMDDFGNLRGVPA